MGHSCPLPDIRGSVCEQCRHAPRRRRLDIEQSLDRSVYLFVHGTDPVLCRVVLLDEVAKQIRVRAAMRFDGRKDWIVLLMSWSREGVLLVFV